MWTHPALPGTARSVQVRPSSSLIMTALVSWSPTQGTPGVATQWKTGSSQRPPGSTVTGCRTKTPPRPVAGKRVRTGPQVRPESSEIRVRTSAVSWLPAS